jgi:hypothetical protein
MNSPYKEAAQGWMALLRRSQWRRNQADVEQQRSNGTALATRSGSGMHEKAAATAYIRTGWPRR